MKITTKENTRVEVLPKTDFYGFNLKNAAEVCEQIKNDIRRHVDNVSQVIVISDSIAQCSFCRAAWTEDGDTYNGGCCKADEYAEEVRREKAKDQA